MGMMIIIVLALAATETTRRVESESISLPGCPDSCGDVKVPYPFGTSQGCSLSDKFSINCSQSSEPQTPYLDIGNLQVTNISLQGGELGIMHFVARDCYNDEGIQVISNSPSTPRSIGCDSYATIRGYRGETKYITGCISSCDFIDSFNNSGLKNITVRLSSFSNHKFVNDFNPCSYAFLVEEGKFKFSDASFRELHDKEMLPMVLNWATGEESCDEAHDRSDFACNGPGYLCQCLPGYEGNPYLPDGCQDIDECKISNPCDKSSTCQNLPGNWTCICPHGGISSETGCGKVCGSNQSPRALVQTSYYIIVIVFISLFL